MSNLMKIRPVGAELFHTDSRKDRHDEANSDFSQILQKGSENNYPKCKSDVWLTARRNSV